MTNLTRLPVQDGFQTTLAQAWNGGTGTVYLNDTPAAVLGSDKTCIVVDPGKSYMQVAEINAINTSLDTVTVSSISIKSAKGVTYAQVSHSPGAVVIISDNYQFWEDIQTAINSKLDSTGGNSTTTYDLEVSGTDWRHRSDSGIMKFTDDEQSEVSLKTLADAAGVNDKTKISVADTTAGYLDTKVTVTAPVVKAITSPAGDERLNLSHDFSNTTYYKSTSAGAGDVGKVPKLDATGKLDSTLLPPYTAYHSVGVVFTRDTSLASGTQVVTHNLWYTPQTIMFDTLRAGDYSFGTYDGTNNVCIYGDNASTSPGSSSSYSIRTDDSGSDFATGVVSAVSTTTFTITWTKTGSAAGTALVKATVMNVS